MAVTRKFLSIILCVSLFIALPTRAQSSFSGTIVKAEVLDIIDGDTIRVKAEIWKSQYLITSVRLLGIDAPELRTPKCPEEKDLAVQAKNLLERLIGNDPVFLKDIAHDKYGERVLAKVITAKNLDAGAEMLAAHLAVPYEGKKRQSWCN